MKVSLVLTVKDEQESIGRLLDSLLGQTRKPDEVIIADGGSSDGTVDAILSFQEVLPLRVVLAPGANISEGRNRAIRDAASEIIACTDAGVVLDPKWLEKLVQPFETVDYGESAERVDVVSGFFVCAPESVFESALGAATLPLPAEIDPSRFLPSSRSVAFRKSAWEAVGGYPEWLDYCEDLVFDLALKEKGYAFRFAPDALVHFRPRSGLGAFFKQYYHYARGDGKADLWRKRHAMRYGTYLVAAATVAHALARRQFWALGFPALGGLLYLWRPYRRLAASWEGSPLSRKMAAMGLIPVVRLAGDIAKMLGYPVGVRWRMKGRGPGRG